MVKYANSRTKYRGLGPLDIQHVRLSPLIYFVSHHRFLLKEDDMTQLEFNASGLITRSKQVTI